MATPKTKTNSVVDGDQLLSKDTVLTLLGGIGAGTLWKWMQGPQQFPLPIELGHEGRRATTIMWWRSEVYAWLAERPRRKIGQGQFLYRGKGAKGPDDVAA